MSEVVHEGVPRGFALVAALSANLPTHVLLACALATLPSALWSQRLEFAIGPASDSASGLVIDDLGNVSMVGTFTGVVDFDPGTEVSELSSAGNSDVYVTTYDASGQFLRGFSFGGLDTDVGTSLARSGDGGFRVSGYFHSTADFDPGTSVLDLTSAGSADGFLASYDASGDLAWAFRVGGSEFDVIHQVAVTSNGASVVVGSFDGSADFDAAEGVFELSSGDSPSVFVAKYDSAGSFLWAFALPGAEAESLALDDADNVYVAGEFADTVDFDPGVDALSLTSDGDTDVFLAKYDPTGAVLWATRAGGGGPDSSLSVAADGSGNSCVAGFFRGTADFDPGPDVLQLESSGGASDTEIFVARYTPSGDPLWAFAVGGVDSDQLPLAVALDEVGSCFVTGYFRGAADFDPGRDGLPLTAAGLRDAFVAKYSQSGAALWAFPLFRCEGFAIAAAASRVYVAGSLLGPADFDPNAGELELGDGNLERSFLAGYLDTSSLGFAFSVGTNGLGRGLAVGPEGDLRVAGGFVANADFDPGAGVSELANVRGDVFLGRYSDAGELCWAFSVGGSQWDFCQDVVVDSVGSSYLTGIFFSPDADFDPGPSVFELTSVDTGSAFLSKYDFEGTFQWAISYGPADAQEIAIHSDSSSLYVTGSFRDTVDFDSRAGVTELTSGGETDMFLAKYDFAGDLLWAVAAAGSSFGIGNGVAVDSAGNAFVTGSFRSEVDFDPGPVTLQLESRGNSDMFLAKYDPNGGLLWANAVSGTGYEFGEGVAVDPAGNACVVGRFRGLAEFDPGPSSFELTSRGSGADDILLAKYAPSGELLWAINPGGPGSDRGFEISVDNAGNSYIAGSYEFLVDFDPGPESFELTSAANTDIFTAKYDGDGDFVRAYSAGGGGNDQARAVFADEGHNVYVAGSFVFSAEFYPGPGVRQLVSADGSNIFLAKYTNEPPVCILASPYTGSCGGTETNVLLGEVSASDPEGSPVVFSWTNINCPGASFDDSSAETPLLTIDSSEALPLECVVQVTVTDDGGASASYAATVRIDDLQAPVITLHGEAEMTIECGSELYVEEGALADDHCDGGISVAASGDAVDTTTPGTYQVIYEAEDSSGNVATPVVRLVRVEDTEPPTVTLSGPERIEIDCLVPFEDPGATATDNCDASVEISVSGDTVNPAVPGTYVLVYEATDGAGNPAEPTVRVVEVLDTAPPAITLIGADVVSLECGVQSYEEPGVDVTDSCDMEPEVQVSGDLVDTATRGTYVVTYGAVDLAGNAAVPVSRTVTVQDTSAPVILLNGPALLELACDSEEYVEQGVTVSDGCDAAVSVVIGGDRVDSRTAGTYEITYDATDTSGNRSQATRTVLVLDQEAPELECPVDVTLSANLGCDFVLETGRELSAAIGSVSATDNCTEPESLQLESDAPEVLAAGTTSVTWTATDAAGNTSACTQSVTVVDDAPPVVTCPARIVVEANAGCSYVGEFGAASAADTCSSDGSVTVRSNAPGSFPIGESTVTWTATDLFGNVASCEQIVEVVDTLPPTLFCPGVVVVECQESDGSLVEFSASATDNCGLDPKVACSSSSGTRFPLGRTEVTCSATDESGNLATCTFDVLVTCSDVVLPGDCNADGAVDISDALCLLGILFLGTGRELPCGDGGINDPANQRLMSWGKIPAIDISDAVALLNWSFLGGPPHVEGTVCKRIEGCPTVCALGK